MAQRVFTSWRADVFFPHMYKILPQQIVTYPIQRGHFGFVRPKHVSPMLVTDYISWFRVPPPCEFHRSSWCYKVNPIGPVWD